MLAELDAYRQMNQDPAATRRNALAPPPFRVGLVLFSLATLTNQKIWPKQYLSLSSGSVILSSSQVVESASCSIYVLDPARDLGMPACNYADTAIWPHALKKTGLGGSTVPLQHWEYQYAVHLWLEEAVIDNGARTDRLSRADLVGGCGGGTGIRCRAIQVHRICSGCKGALSFYQYRQLKLPGMSRLLPQSPLIEQGAHPTLYPSPCPLHPRYSSTCIAMRLGGRVSGGRLIRKA